MKRRRAWSCDRRLFTAGLGAFAAAPGLAGMAARERADESAVPEELRALYATLEAAVDEAERLVEQGWDGSAFDGLAYGADLSTANGHRGETLLTPRGRASAALSLDRYQEIGMTGVKVAIPYPILTPAWPRYKEYIAFYQWLREELRRRKMYMHVGSGPLFREAEYTPLDPGPFYDALPGWQAYLDGRRDQVRAIAAEVGPDSLMFANEPTVEEGIVNRNRKLGTEQHLVAETYATFVASVVASVPKNGARFGAGSGTWDRLDYIDAFTQIEGIDLVDLHTYPLSSAIMTNTLKMCALARERGKDILIGESWLYKASPQEIASGGVTLAGIFARDTYSFFAPLDQRWHEVLIKLGHRERMRMVSPYWARYYFAYLDYAAVKDLSPVATLARETALSVESMTKGVFTSTGEHYGKLIADWNAR